jgi:hypothetical protein
MEDIRVSLVQRNNAESIGIRDFPMLRLPILLVLKEWSKGNTA